MTYKLRAYYSNSTNGNHQRQIYVLSPKKKKNEAKLWIKYIKHKTSMVYEEYLYWCCQDGNKMTLGVHLKSIRINIPIIETEKFIFP